MLQNVVLHNLVVMMGIYADVLVMREAEVHDVVEYAMNIWIAGYSMYNMIRLCVIKPFTIIDFTICGFWRWKKSKVTNNLITILNDIAAIPFHISHYGSLRRIAIAPLVHIARLPHNSFCSIHDFHNLSHVRRSCLPDNPAHFTSFAVPVLNKSY